MKRISLTRLRFADLVSPGDVIAWPQGPGEPLALTENLVAQRADLPRTTLLFGLTHSNTLHPDIADRFDFQALNGAGASRRVTALADIIPNQVSTLPTLITGGHIRVDIALIQVRPLPAGGYTLGVIADFTQAMIQYARTVIALLNPALPLMEGDARVDENEIDWLVDGDDRILDMPDPQPSLVELEVARRVVELIPDGATLQLGVGTLPAAVAQSLVHHRELGVHSGVVSDVLVDLVERGVVTNTKKGVDVGHSVTGGLFGTQRLRDFVGHGGQVVLRNADYTHQIATAKSLSALHTINSVIESRTLPGCHRRPGRFCPRGGGFPGWAFDFGVSLHHRRWQTLAHRGVLGSSPGDGGAGGNRHRGNRIRRSTPARLFSARARPKTARHHTPGASRSAGKNLARCAMTILFNFL